MGTLTCFLLVGLPIALVLLAEHSSVRVETDNRIIYSLLAIA